MAITNGRPSRQCSLTVKEIMRAVKDHVFDYGRRPADESLELAEQIRDLSEKWVGALRSEMKLTAEAEEK